MNTPRFQRSPIDTSVYSRMMHRDSPQINMIDNIRKIITDITGINPNFDTSYRGKELVRARQLFIYFVKKHTGLCQREVGNLLGKDHATICHAIKCVDKFRQIEYDYRDVFETIEKKINKIKLLN